MIAITNIAGTKVLRIEKQGISIDIELTLDEIKSLEADIHAELMEENIQSNPELLKRWMKADA